MRNRKWKFGIGIGIILAVVAWEAISGFQQSKTYYVTVAELVSGKAARSRVRVGGVVAQDSVERHGGTVTFP
jgi:cytochrome c-type biogenesis protein CcmE